jgi:thiopurine S-methyltransferase
MIIDRKYWEDQYLQNKTGWDIGYASPPLVDYIDQLTDKNLKILIPGAGNAWEAEYLWNHGFQNTFMLDYSQNAIAGFKKRFPDFPEKHILEEDFFHHKDQYDLILEQTFFTSLLPVQREDYVNKMFELLKEKGKLVGVVFNHEFPFESPPFGANPNVYIKLFKPLFYLKVFETAYNSIKPRKSRENFIIAIRKINKVPR